jgi:hypothetical protein
MPSFDRIRHRRHDASVFLYADLIELNGDDLRRDPLEVRKATLASAPWHRPSGTRPRRKEGRPLSAGSWAWRFEAPGAP